MKGRLAPQGTKGMIHVAFNIDKAYVRFCAVTMASLLENNRGEAFAIHVLGRGLDAADERALRGAVPPCGDARLFFYRAGEELLDGFSVKATHGRISLATYLRCFLADFLPRDVERVLYLDCDVLVLSSVRAFWETPMDEGVAVVAVEDVGAGDGARYDRMGYPRSDSYFNAGVMLVNLGYWRGHGVSRAAARLFREHPERIVFNDQDILNILFHRDKRLADIRWNMQDGFYRARRAPAPPREALLRPAILHFTNRKPWEPDNQHPLRHLFFRYQDLTAWRGLDPLAAPLGRVRRFFRLLPFRLRLRKPKYVSLPHD